MLWDMSDSEQIENFSPPRLNRNQRYCNIFPMDSSFEDKENLCESPKAKLDSDISLYENENNSPARMSCDGSPAAFSLRRPSEEDHNSLDSGYSASESAKFFSPKSRGGLSFGSLSSMDEAFLDISELEHDDDNTKLPGDFNKLISGSIASNNIRESPVPGPSYRPPFRRALSLINNTDTPNSRQVRACLFKEENELRNFKRPEPPTDVQSPMSAKRSRLFQDKTIRRIPAKVVLQRSMSATEDSIKLALQRSTTEPDLIGDFTKAFCLPLTPGRHQDLKSITPTTLARLMNGEYSETVASFKVVDCRYPYEFEGGHVMGAQNLYTKQQILDELLNVKNKTQPEITESHKRHILVFHCEFSSERGPNLSRYLRNIDRSQNKDYYPHLHYPEVYLLDGGYKRFYEGHADLCTPDGYLPMLHPDHEHNLRHFRAKSKTWNADSKSKSNLRSTSFKRI